MIPTTDVPSELISCDRANSLDPIPMSLFSVLAPPEPISVQEIKKGHGAATLKISSRMMLLKKWAVYREKVRASDHTRETSAER